MSASESRSAVVLALAEEFLERYRQGERPSLKEYIDRHPELAAEIKDVFPAMALMENVALADESLAGDATGPTMAMSTAPPQQLGDFRIIREVGRGGMGIVYEAEQISLGRHVALKVLPRKLFLDAQQRRRFEREAKAAARLHHTNIVPVFGVGEYDGMPYYVMQFIQGLGLDDVLDELRRMQSDNMPTVAAGGGNLRVSRKDVSVADVARSLLTGEFQGPMEGIESPQPGIAAPGSEESVTTIGKLSDSFTLSSVKLPGSGDAVSEVKGKKATYWQSVAQIGVQVAEALDYAHKQGILHRDIKPSNLLLDTRGTVWVTDFGLARAENENHLTATGDIVGTLRYMPPEAFEGQSDKRSDIYSLGLTLYELLALQPAFAEKDRHKLIKRVTTEEPARLDRLNRQVPRDLVTIVHKAIDREPSRRYVTAGELAADLQRFLDDEPIRARRISSVECLTRWCRHHPGVASLTALLVLLLIGVTAASLLAAAHFDRLACQEARAAENERLARQEAEQAKEHEATLRGQAEAAKQQAEQQKQQAESNFAKARKAVDDYFTTVSESQLLQVPGMQPLRRELLQSALAFYQDFLKERGDDPALRGELAAAYLRVGKIHAELGEGAEARKAYKQACALYEALTKAAPESVEWRHGLAQCYFRLGRHEEAIALWQKLTQPGQPRFQKELAEAYNGQGVSHDKAGRSREALQAHQQSLTIREMLARLNPDDADAQRDLSGTLNNIGVLLVRKGRLAEALAMYRRATEHGEIAFALAPQMIMNGRFLAIQWGNIAHIERQLGHVNEALAAYRRTVEVWRTLTRDNPAVPWVHSGLFTTYKSLAGYQRELKQIEQAERTTRLAREVIEHLPSDGPDALFRLACIRAECSTLLGQGKDNRTAEEQAEQKHEADLAMEALGKAVAAGFRDLGRFRTARELNALRGREDFKALEADLAARVAAAPSDKLKAGQQALALRQKLAQADPTNKRLRADLAASQHAITLILLDLGKLDEARKHLNQALALREALLQEELKNAHYQADLAASRFTLGDLYWQSGQLAEGVKVWQQELDAWGAAAHPGQERSSLAGPLLTMRRTIAQRYAWAGLWPEATAHYGRLLQLAGATNDDYYKAACLALRAGDVAAYRHACAQWMQRVGDSDDLFQLYSLARLSVLTDRSGVEPSQAIQWTQKSTGRNPPKEWWRCHILGLAHYRAGQFAEAITQANRSNSFAPSRTMSILNYPVLALAHHRLGHAAEAQDWLDKARAEWRRLSPLQGAINSLTMLPAIPKDHWETYWHDWVTFEILCQEASRAITGSPPMEEAYDHAHRSFLYGRLGEVAKAEAEWQAAVKILPREPRIWLARARQLVERKCHKKAEAALARIEEFDSNDPKVWKECGRLRFELGQTAKATADFRKAVELLGDKALPSEPAASEADKLFARLADDALLRRLTAAIERSPEDGATRWQRGEWYARHSRWKEAAADFTIALQQQPPDDPWKWLHVAPALVAAGDREGYHRHRREALKRFGETQNPRVAEMVTKACLLLPEVSRETELACRLVDWAVAQGNQQWAYYVITKGLADYRRGDFPAAVAGLDALLSRRAMSPDTTALYHPLLAMALHRRGKVKAAREHLAQSAKLLDRHVHDPSRFPTIADGIHYNHDWLIAWLLHREAQTLIEGKEAEFKK